MTAASRPVSRAGYDDRRFFRSRILGLTVACPYNQGNPAHCQFCLIRELPLVDRYRWVTSLKFVELARIVDEHEHCLRATERTDGPIPRRPLIRVAVPLEEAAAIAP